MIGKPCKHKFLKNEPDYCMYLQKTEPLVYEEGDSDDIGECEDDSNEHVDLEDVSDNDSDASADDIPCGSQAKANKRNISRSSEEPYTDSWKAKKRRLSTSNDNETTDPESAPGEQECSDESAWGMYAA